ncbi:hypothetical protein [Streptomyces atratus]|uniref:hypothetical protein n=1 Tax=Streptomyces atratus TaxID=1893 RepID=UPI00365DF65B
MSAGCFWSPEGEAAVLEFARRVSGGPQLLALCGIGTLPVRTLAANHLTPLTVDSDLDTALGALGAARG